MTEGFHKKNRFIPVVILILGLSVLAQPVTALETDGVWELEHLYSQKVSAGSVTDLYPSSAEWSPELLIFGIQFLNYKMAILHCETPSGSINVDFNAFFTQKEHTDKSNITFILENGEEIVLSLFMQDDGAIIFSYNDAGPQPDKVGELKGSAGKLLFRNHIGRLIPIQ